MLVTVGVKGLRKEHFYRIYIQYDARTQILLTNRVQGLYCKLRTKFFPVYLRPKREQRLVRYLL